MAHDDKMNQDKFDTVIQFLLDTIGSFKYLDWYNIPISKPITDWKNFVKRINNQESKTAKTIVPKPGLYPKSFGRGQGVHFYALIDKNGITRVGNGYISHAGIDKKYSDALDVQPDHSHGLCQTFALMYYLEDKDLNSLTRGDYFNNALIGLKWLEKFTTKHDLNFNSKTSNEIKNICEIIGSGNSFKLSNLVKFILKKENKQFLQVWFQVDKTVSSQVAEIIEEVKDNVSHAAVNAAAAAAASATSSAISMAVNDNDTINEAAASAAIDASNRTLRSLRSAFRRTISP